MMDEDRFDRFVREAAPGYRPPPAPPLEAMWKRIEESHFGDSDVNATPLLRLEPPARRAPRFPRWWLQSGLGIAATLLVGIGIGRFTAPGQEAMVDVAPIAAANAPGSDASERMTYDLATTQYLGQTAALLNALPSEVTTGRTDRFFITQASDLLSTTRLLIDSPAAADPELRILLDDLELVLAQIARLPTKRSAAELDLITEALEQRDVLPRLRSAAAGLPNSDI